VSFSAGGPKPLTSFVSVILAEWMDGKSFDADHLRVIVPLDMRSGRIVQDVTHIEVATPLFPKVHREISPRWFARMRYGKPRWQ
jgi:hypothetical protein